MSYRVLSARPGVHPALRAPASSRSLTYQQRRSGSSTQITAAATSMEVG